MGHCHVDSSNVAKELCTIATQLGKCDCQLLPMELCDSPDIFQEKMNDSLNGLDTAHVCINNVLHATKESWKDHFTGLHKVFRRLQQAGLKVNTKKSNFGVHRMECSGCNITRAGIQSVPKKAHAIQAVKCPKPTNNHEGIIGMINLHHNMWKNCALLAASTANCSHV
jgi:hypothetical protein